MEESLHYALMLAYFDLQKQVREKTAQEGLHPGEPKILETLYYHDGCDQKSLSKYCMLTPASVTGILDRMEAGGLLERRKEEGNRRSSYAFLTPQGKKKAVEVIKIFKELDAKVLQNFDEDEWANLLQGLRKLYKDREGE